jgi:hypothetical protein
MCVKQRHHRLEARPAGVHDEQPEALVPQQHLFEQQRIAESHPKPGMLHRDRTRFIRRSWRPWAHVDADGKIELFGEGPIRLHSGVARRDPQVLQ